MELGKISQRLCVSRGEFAKGKKTAVDSLCGSTFVNISAVWGREGWKDVNFKACHSIVRS